MLAVALFDRDAPFPSWRAAVPVLAAVLVLAAQRNSAWTGHRLAQWLGNRSYSLYLWHWPVFVTLAYVERAQNPVAIAAGLVVTALLGYVSYRWIEHDARSLLGRLRLRHAAIALVAMAAPRCQVSRYGRNTASPTAFRSRSNWSPTRKTTSIRAARCATRTRVRRRRRACMAAPGARAGVVQWSYSAFVPGMHITPAAPALQGPGYQCAGFIDWAQAQLDAAPATLPVVVIGR